MVAPVSIPAGFGSFKGGNVKEKLFTMGLGQLWSSLLGLQANPQVVQTLSTMAQAAPDATGHCQ